MHSLKQNRKKKRKKNKATQKSDGMLGLKLFSFKACRIKYFNRRKKKFPLSN